MDKKCICFFYAEIRKVLDEFFMSVRCFHFDESRGYNPDLQEEKRAKRHHTFPTTQQFFQSPPFASAERLVTVSTLFDFRNLGLPL